MKKLFLLDAMALIYRAYYGFAKNPRLTSKGMNTSAIFGFTTRLALLQSAYIFSSRPTNLRTSTLLSQSSAQWL